MNRTQQVATEFLRKAAAAERTVWYSEVSDELATYAIFVHPHSAEMAHLLGDISTAEDAEGRFMLSAIVVHKNGDSRPGSGFFDCAQSIGKSVGEDPTAFWTEELKAVFEFWAKKRGGALAGSTKA